MAYTAWSVVYGEQPSAAKWNLLGSNDASFNDGTGIAAGVIGTTHLANASVTADKLTGTDSDAVATGQTTASTTYTDLATAGPSATVTVGANGLVLVGGRAQMSNNGAGNYCLISVNVSGANTIAATDNNGFGWNMGTSDYRAGWCYLFSGLSTGSTTFKMQYRVTAGTGTFTGRHIFAIPL